MKTNRVWELTGYTPITHYWELFSEITDLTVLDQTFNETWKKVKESKDSKIIAEYVMVLNHCCWEASDLGRYFLSRAFGDLYYQTHDYALDNLKGGDLLEYLQIVD